MKKMILVLVCSFGLCRPVCADLETELDTVVVTATRIEENQYRLAGNVTVLTEDFIKESTAQNIPDLLKESVGVNVYDNSTSKSSIVDIRGFGDTAARNVLVLVNGRKINSIDISGPDLVQVPIESIERIEIIRGGASVLYGDNAVGGVVNIITKRGEGDLTGRAGFYYDTYKSFGEDLEVSGKMSNISYFLYGKYLDKGGYRTNSDLTSRDVNLRLGYDVSDYLSMDFATGWHDDDQRLPGGLTAAQLSSRGPQGSVTQDDYTTTEDQYFQLSLHVDPFLKEKEFGEFVVDLTLRDRDVFDSFNSFGAFNTGRSISTKGIAAKYVFDRTVFSKEVNFVTGLDYYDHQNDIIGSGSNVDNITIAKEELGFFGFLQYEMLKSVFVNGGTRYHKAQYIFDQKNVPIYASRRPDEWVSMGGMKYEYAEGSNLHFNVQQTFRFLSTDEWYSTANFPGFGITPGLNLNLEQQTGIQYELGLKHNFNNTAIVSVTPYWMDLKNEIFFDPVTFANSNYDKTRRIGVEVGERLDLLKLFDWDMLDQLEFFANYTFQYPRFIDGANNDKEIPMVPRHMVGHGLTAKWKDRYRLSLLGSYVGSRFAINDVQNVTPAAKPYYVMDLKFSYERRNFEAFVGLNNMFNEQYSTFVSKSTSSTTKNFFPSPGRNVEVGCSLKF